ncbi:MAG: VanZ family protein [Nitrospirota bacterium]|nr:VanZ family protein [Nitrospirota bacterium]MDH4362015.1 VanZ family protein [Nitrospirota bacterium]
MTSRTHQESNPRSLVSRLTVPGLLVSLFGFMMLLWIPVPSHTTLWKAFNNFCHVPLFGGVAIIVLSLARRIGEPREWSVGSHYGLAFMGVVLLGVVSEGVQSLSSSRQAEWSDLLLDVVGAICALGLYATYDRNLTGRSVVWRQAPRKYMVHIGVGLVLVVAMSPVFIRAYANWDRAARFPSLCQFSSVWEMMFVQEMNSAFQIVPPP